MSRYRCVCKRSIHKLQSGPSKKSRYSTGYRPGRLPGDLKSQPFKGLAVIFLVWMILGLVSCIGYALENKAEANIPDRAYKYRAFLIRQAHFEFGLNAPIPMFAAQIHQESAWRPDVSSPYAHGLTQFTPDTAKWISEVFPDLGTADVFNPKWAIRAMLKYDKYLHSKFPKAASECDRWAFALSSYNGGLGWVKRDMRLTSAAGDDPTKWWGNVEKYSNRADWAIEENRGYPKRILYRNQEFYINDGNRWAGAKICRQEELEKDTESVTETIPETQNPKVSEPVIFPVPMDMYPLLGQYDPKLKYMQDFGMFYWMVE